jgi:tRNA(fMet)-specific endonuclease VapC
VNPAYLIDTDWVIQYLNGDLQVVQRVDSLRPQGVRISLISVAELWEGVFYGRDPQRAGSLLEAFLRGVGQLGIDQEICRLFGRERGRLRRARLIIGDFDLLIAATALHYNLTLLTNNRRHFERVRGLAIESV